jgi:Flp pilus assembly pilin Flp
MLRAAGLLRAVVNRFRKDEDGGMTVEWVAIAAAVVVGAVAMTWSVLSNLDPVADAIGTSLTDAVGTIEDPD